MNNKSLFYIVLATASLCLSTQSRCMEKQITVVAPNPQSLVAKSVAFAQQPIGIQQLQPQNIQQIQQQQQIIELTKKQITERTRNETTNLADKYRRSKSFLNTKRNSINNVPTINTKACLTNGDEDIYAFQSTAGKETPHEKLYFTFMSTVCLFVYLLTIVQALG
jgi:hypothetical protein